MLELVATMLYGLCMLYTYLNQLEEAARYHNVEVESVLSRCNVARSTWWRWKTGKSAPSENTARKILNALVRQVH